MKADTTGEYLKSIGAAKPLKWEEQAPLFKALQTHWHPYVLDASLAKGTTLKTDLSPEEARSLQYGRKVRDRLIKTNMRLVIQLASKYKNRGLDLPDLIAEGAIGLAWAVHKFDLSKGFVFSTYATHWIKQGITRAIKDKGRAIRLPIYLDDKIGATKKLANSYAVRHGAYPSADWLAEQMKATPAQVREWLSFAANVQCKSLSELTINGDEIGLFIEDVSQNAEEMTLREERREEAIAFLRKLKDKRQRYVLQERAKERSLKEIGDELGLSRERVRQIYNKAMGKLQYLARYKGEAKRRKLSKRKAA